MTLRAGDRVGRYQVLAPIGAGGMAAVYAARVVGAESFEKRVALKVMLPHLSRDAKFEKMFGDEARVAAQVVSPYVVGTIDLGRDPHEGLYQVLDLVVGASLRHLLDASPDPMPLDVALTLLAQVARGLADAHAARAADGTPLGIVHRDVSPHNVLVGVDGRARLSDFGVARAAASVSTTESGELKGKLAYAAPEQLGGEVADARSDVFALGIVSWEVLANRRLFVADNPLALVDAMVSRPIPRLDEVRPEIDAALASIVASALVRARDDRTVPAAELATAFEEAARDNRGVASAERIGEVVRARGGEALASIEAALRAPLPATEVAPAPRSGRWPLLVVAAILVALASWAFAARPVAAPPVAPTTIAAPIAPPAPTSTVVIAPPASAAVVEPPPTSAPPIEDPRDTRRPIARVPRADPPPSEALAPPTSVAPPPSATGLLGVEDFDRDDPR